MKKNLLILIFLLSFTSVLFSQSIKLGHINSQELVLSMPENDSAQVKLERHARELQNQLAEMQSEFNSKYNDYVSKRNGFSETVRLSKESELQDMNQRMQQFQQLAQEDIEKARTETYKPILDKVKKAISDVSKENGFTYIFDTSQGLLLFHADNSIDIMGLVKRKIGIK